MTNRVLILVVLLAASAAATTLDGFVGKFTYLKVPGAQGYLTNPFTDTFHAIEERVQPRWEVDFGVWWNVTGKWTLGPFYRITPGFSASPWLPDGTQVLYEFQAALAVFNVSDVDLDRDFQWGVNGLAFRYWLKENLAQGAFAYGLQVAAKTDGAVIACHKPVKVDWSRSTDIYYIGATFPSWGWIAVYNVSLIPQRVGYLTAFGMTNPVFINATCPGVELADVYVVDVYYAKTRPEGSIRGSETKLCVSWMNFTLVSWWQELNPARPRIKPMTMKKHCDPWPGDPPKTYMAVAREDGLYIYVDGRLHYVIRRGGLKLFTAPYKLLGWFTATSAFTTGQNELKLLKPLGTVKLYIGNETLMAPPQYALDFSPDPIWGGFEAAVKFSWDSGTYVGPGRPEGRLTYNRTRILLGSINVHVHASEDIPVYVRPGDVSVRLHGRVVQLPYGALLNGSRLCPAGGLVAEGAVLRRGDLVEVRGPASIYCTRYPITFATPAGSATVVADANTTLTWQPPPIVYPNGTKLEADPVSVFVDGPRTVRVNYTRVYYLVRVSTFNGTFESWHPRGGEMHMPGVVVLKNGTRLVAHEIIINGRAANAAVFKVDKPLNVTIRYGRQYLVKLIAPVNSTEVWADEGSVFKVGLADPWEPGNGTLFKRLLVNGTSAREFRVDRPMTLKAHYAEVYYWAVVETPVNKTAGWMPKGAVLKFPDIINFGNGTRLVRLGPASIHVDRPVAAKVEYKKQYHVKIVGVEEWEGWADAGAVIRLNSTVVGGVEYTPVDETDAVVVTAPGVYKPLFYAVYRTVARDVLGVPNPLATVKLCNATAQAGLAGFVVVETYAQELCQPAVEAFPISPYTVAGAAAVATAAALALKRKKK
jgi:hypothetical protein